MELGKLVADALFQVVLDVLPIVAIVFAFQLFVLRKRPPNLRRVLVGTVYVVLGLALFLIGLEEALFPIGRTMAQQLTAPAFISPDGLGALAQGLVAPVRWPDYYWVYLYAAAIGFATTVAEPSLIAVAIKANSVSGGTVGIWGLRSAVAIGVALGVTLGTFRIVVGLPLHYFLIGAYVLVIAQTMLAQSRDATKTIIPLAYDSGGVTTSTVTVPLLAALGLGLASTIPGRSPLIDGFGLIAFASVFPIITVLAYAQLGELRARRRASSTVGGKDEV
ncbi:MAG: DUF1538 domain-containing protein [Proteobacteria bacterium]|nr:DUF1538 domain-containing protein [Pseudomonadota bacterium]